MGNFKRGKLIIQALGLRISISEAEASKLSSEGVKSLREEEMSLSTENGRESWENKSKFYRSDEGLFDFNDLKCIVVEIFGFLDISFAVLKCGHTHEIVGLNGISPWRYTGGTVRQRNCVNWQ